MSPMNFDNNRSIPNLVSAYEMMKKEGKTAFLEEKSYIALAGFYEGEERLNEALDVIEQAIQQYQYSADLHIKKAQLLIDFQQEDLALSVLDLAAAFAPSEIEIQLLKAEALISLELFNEAIELLHDAKEVASNEKVMADIYFLEAQVYENQEQFERMFYALSAVLKEIPNHQEALERLWLCVELSKKYEDSVRLHKEILDRDPYSYVAWYNLGHAQAYLGQYADAIESFEFAFVIKEDFEFAYRDCSELCFELKLYHKALKYYKEILELFEPDSEIFLRIGQCYQALQSSTIARTFYLRALKLDPLNDEVFFHLGQCYASEGKWDSAISSFKKAIRIEDKQEEYMAAIAAAYEQTQENKKAEKFWKIAIKIAPEESAYWVKLAQFYINEGRATDAIVCLDDAETFAVGSDINYCRIACLFILGRRQEAIYWLGEALLEDFDTHNKLFDFLPELEDDHDVINLISAYMWR